MTTPIAVKIIDGIAIPEPIADRYPNVHPMRVVGDSMLGDDIHDGDLLLVDPDSQCQDGDICAIYVSNWLHSDTGKRVSGYIVKRLACGGTVAVSSNPKYPPRTLLPEYRPIVYGLVVGRVHYFSNPEEGKREAS